MSRRRFLCTLATLVMLVGFVSLAQAKVKLPSIISDNMVIQQGEPVTIWGWAKPGENLIINVGGSLPGKQPENLPEGVCWYSIETYLPKADKEGRWETTFSVMKGAGPLDMTITDSSDETTEVKNILVGEVWLCSGQSNMELPLVQCNNAKKEIAAADYPDIRIFEVKNVTAETPQTDCEGRWVIVSPKTIAGLSAVGYFFGRELQKELKVPVGLIQSDWGATPAESWTSRKTLESKPTLKPLLNRWDKAVKADPKQAKSPRRPANLYNGMIAPLLPYTIHGAIWYQGESNVARAHQYRTIFPTMIADWREGFKNSDLPFGFVQIAPYRYVTRKISPYLCPELWEAQLLTLKNTPNTGMVVTTDIGDIKNIHPKNKQDVGKRLADWALATVYGKDRVYSGPIYQSMKVEGDKIRLVFDHVGGGLQSSDGKPLSHFEIAGADGKYHAATAQIDGNSLVVASDAVKSPKAVRFAWHETAESNFGNREGLPASPFRTDTSKCLTEGKN